MTVSILENRGAGGPSLDATRLLLLTTLLLLFAGCESGVRLSGNATISPRIQALATAEGPALVVFTADIPKTGEITYSLGVLCEAQEEAMSFPIHHSAFGCAKEGVAEVRVVPLKVEEPGDILCGPDLVNRIGLEISEFFAQASQAVFVGSTGSSGCPSGKANVEFVLE